jgi:hypothetical protein
MFLLLLPVALVVQHLKEVIAKGGASSYGW